MKNIYLLADECITDLIRVGIPIRPVRNWLVGTSGKNMWGQCKAVENGMFDIRISAALLQDEVDDQAVKNTIAHELLHTVEGCMNHGQNFHRLAKLVNARCPGYNIKSRTAAEEKGIEMEYKYLLRCCGCNAQIGRHRRSHFVDHPEHYKCSKCGSKFERIK